MEQNSFRQLDRYYGRNRAERVAVRPSLRFEQLGGTEIENEFGSLCVLDRAYSWDRLPGAASVAPVRDRGWQPVLVDPRLPERVELAELACIDIETTGLSIGAGTVAFLIGVIRADNHGLVLRQYLIRDFFEEPAQQVQLARDLNACELLVTYNGGRFDLPVLRSRAVINRIDADWLERPHLDLLFPIRSVWKHVWPDCRLATAEMRLLGVERTVDCEGWEVPLRYRQFLNDPEESHLLEVIEHNAQDLISLILLAAAVQRVFEANTAPFGFAQAELFGLAQSLYARGRVEESISTLHEAHRQGRLAPGYGRAMRLLVRLLKQAGNWQSARDVWRDLQHAADPLERCWALIEEAKFQEHRSRDLVRAREATVEAMQALGHRGGSGSLGSLMASLHHRLARLDRRSRGG